MPSLLRPSLIACCLLILVSTPTLHAAPEPSPEGESPEGEEDKDDKGPKPYAEVITDEMTSRSGLFTVHRDGDDVYFEIPPAELGKDMLWVTQPRPQQGEAGERRDCRHELGSGSAGRGPARSRRSSTSPSD